MLSSSRAGQGKVTPLPGAANPSVLSFRAPDAADLLRQPVVGTPGLAKLPVTSCTATGDYALDLTASGGTTQYRATLKRKARKLPSAQSSLANGLSPVSFAADGIKTVMAGRGSTPRSSTPSRSASRPATRSSRYFAAAAALIFAMYFAGSLLNSAMQSLQQKRTSVPS